MADNVTTGTTGLTVAADEISIGIFAQRVKVMQGIDGTGTDVSTAAPIPAILMSTGATYYTTAAPLPIKISDGTDLLAIDTNGSAQVQVAQGATVISSGAPFFVKISDGTDLAAIDTNGSVQVQLFSGATAVSSAVPLGVRMSDGTTNRTIDVGGAARTTLYTTAATAITSAVPLMVQLSDATAKNTIDVGGAQRVTLYTTSATAVTFNNNGRAVPGSSAPVVFASQIARSLSSSTGQSIGTTTATTGAAGDWLDGLLITPTSTATGIVQIADGTTGVLSTIVSAGTPNLVPFFIPYPATSATSGWYINIGVNQKVTAFGNFSAG